MGSKLPVSLHTGCKLDTKFWMYVRLYCGPKNETIKANSHIACRAHAAPMPFPCHAVPLRVSSVSFPLDSQSVAVSDSHLPCHAHAMLRSCRSSQGHSTARPSLDDRAVLWP